MVLIVKQTEQTERLFSVLIDAYLGFGTRLRESFLNRYQKFLGLSQRKQFPRYP